MTSPLPVSCPRHLPCSTGLLDHPNPKAASSTATCARRRPAVGRPTHRPPELEKMAEEGRVTFLFDLLIFLFFPFLAAASSDYLVFFHFGGFLV
jgi:hypothetical protein